MATNFPIDPYYDDFDPEKNFRKILFKPSLPVQARELTQLQSILQDQIKKFGDHIFKQGSIVIPGNSTSDLNVPYIKCESNPLITSELIGKVVTNQVGVKAFIKAVAPEEGSDPLTLYLSYFSGGSDGTITFNDKDELSIEGGLTLTAIELDSTGLGSLASVNDGVYYINGSFVTVQKQSIIIGKYTGTPSVHVLLRIDEEIIDSDSDPSLLDPAQGSFNFAAPGADRHQMKLTLTSLPIGAAITADFVEIMRIRDGVVEEHAKTPRYSELEKNLARRTFDESGDYIVEGLEPGFREHLRTEFNGGLSDTGSRDNFVVEVSAGKGYIQGFEVDKISSTRIIAQKARTPDHIKERQSVIRPSYGQYILVSNISGSFSVFDREQITLWNDNDSTNGSATQVGTARVLAIDYEAGTPGPNGIYKLWLTNIQINAGRTLEETGGIRFGASGSAWVMNEYVVPLGGGSFNAGEIVTNPSGRRATVALWVPSTSTLYAYKHDHTQNAPRLGDTITGTVSLASGPITSRRFLINAGQSGMVFRLPARNVLSLRNSANLFDTDYTVHKELTIVTNSSGNGSTVVSVGTILPIEVGTFIALSGSGIVANNRFSLNTNGNTLTLTGGPANTTVRVYCAVRKQSVQPKTKTLTSRSQVFSSPSNVLQLDRTDIIRVVSVIDQVGDITANYRLWNGQTDYAYERGTLTLIAGASTPVGAVTVTYEFFQHSISGDFFSADSYSSVPNFLDRTFSFNSRSTGQVFDLLNCVDFRSSVDENGTFVGALARKNDAVLSDTTFSSSVRFFVPRIDVLTIDPRGQIDLIRGTPDENPIEPVVPVGKLALNSIFVPPYTRRISDIVTSRKDVERFTMRDIKQIVRRVERVERFATLTAQEQQVANFEIRDAATGLNRFKTGILVESFDGNPLVIADATNPDFRANLDRSQLSAPLEIQSCEAVLLNTSSNFRLRNQFATLPFTEVPFAQQMMSSRVTNLNPFLVLRWEGVLNVFPSGDNWIEVVNNPTLFRDEVEHVIIQRWIPVVPWTPPAIRTNTTVVSQTSWSTELPPVQPVSVPEVPPVIISPEAMFVLNDQQRLQEVINRI